MHKDYELVLQKNIFPDLERGRPNWDKPHTALVVEKIKEIVDNSPDLNLDRDVLVIVAYAHDWGYAGLFEQGKEVRGTDEMKAQKDIHGKISAQKLEPILKNHSFDFLSEAQKQRTLHLVEIHDKVEELVDIDEKVFLEADTLASLDIKKVHPTFDRDSLLRQIDKNVINRRQHYFVTEYGKRELKRLLDVIAQTYNVEISSNTTSTL